MSNFITAKIDVTLIEKSRLFHGKKPNRAGKMPQYLDIILIPSENSAFGDSHMIVQSVTKEEREAGTRGGILGNAKEKVWEGVQEDAKPPQRSRNEPSEKQQANQSDDNMEEDVPF